MEHRVVQIWIAERASGPRSYNIKFVVGAPSENFRLQRHIANGKISTDPETWGSPPKYLGRGGGCVAVWSKPANGKWLRESAGFLLRIYQVIDRSLSPKQPINYLPAFPQTSHAPVESHRPRVFLSYDPSTTELSHSAAQSRAFAVSPAPWGSTSM